MAEDASHGGTSRRRKVRTRATRAAAPPHEHAPRKFAKRAPQRTEVTRVFLFFALAQFVSKYGGQRKNLNLDNVQQALEEDSSAVEMLRRDVVTFQEMELDTSRKYLASLRKSYDKLRNDAVRVPSRG